MNVKHNKLRDGGSALVNLRHGSKFDVWRIIVDYQDGVGGSNPRPEYFKEYDDAHDFYKYIISLKGTSFYPSVALPPHPFLFKPLNIKVYNKGEWRPPKKEG